MSFGDEAPSDKPFDDEPFDAGVEADENTDPKKYIEQLTGKLGQSLRKYTEQQGQPDFELEKFAINSLLSATHTAEMDSEDKDDIIKKINTAGNDEINSSNNQEDSSDNSGESDNFGDDNSGSNTDSFSDDKEEDLNELIVFENFFLDEPKKNNMFQEGSNDILDEANPCWKGYKQVGMKEKGGKEVPNCVPVNENHEGGESLNYMFWQNLKTIHHATGELLEMNREKIDEMCANGHAWAVDHISSSADDIEEVYHFFEANIEDESIAYNGETQNGNVDGYGSVEDLQESKKNSIFDKMYLKHKIKETFNQDSTMNEPMIQPQVAPEPQIMPKPDKVQPSVPSRRNKPFLPMPEVKPDPKAKM